MEITAFKELFGDNPTIRVLDFFLTNSYFEYSMADVIREEGMSYNTLKPVWDELLKREILVKTGKLGKGVMYKVNNDSPVVKQLNKLIWTLVETDPETAHYFKPLKSKQRTNA